MLSAIILFLALFSSVFTVGQVLVFCITIISPKTNSNDVSQAEVHLTYWTLSCSLLWSILFYLLN